MRSIVVSCWHNPHINYIVQCTYWCSGKVCSRPLWAWYHINWFSCSSEVHYATISVIRVPRFQSKIICKSHELSHFIAWIITGSSWTRSLILNSNWLWWWTRENKFELYMIFRIVAGIFHWMLTMTFFEIESPILDQEAIWLIISDKLVLEYTTEWGASDIFSSYCCIRYTF